jgi:hypothetical protein
VALAMSAASMIEHSPELGLIHQSDWRRHVSMPRPQKSLHPPSAFVPESQVIWFKATRLSDTPSFSLLN